jgi:hypothetical protein
MLIKMPGPAFCPLDQAYADWEYNPTPYMIGYKPSKAESLPNQKQNNQASQVACPNCMSCLNANNILQQKILDQIIWPRPQYTASEETLYDPYNRNFSHYGAKEHFGGRVHFGNMNLNSILLIVILVVLVIVLLMQAVFLGTRNQ